MLYDAIGAGYASHRQPDPRIAAVLFEALGDAERVINVGAGAGSYEPRDRLVVAVEPSHVMLGQRPPGAAPAVRAVAEALPFGDDAFDGALAVLTVHHWGDVPGGLTELRRVTSGAIAILTFDPTTFASWWLPAEYAPELRSTPGSVPDPETVAALLGPGATVATVPVPAQCIDTFLVAFWDRPELVLDREVRHATSAFARLPAAVQERIAAAVRDDLQTGRWDARHGPMRSLDAFDSGLRLVSLHDRAADPCTWERGREAGVERPS